MNDDRQELAALVNDWMREGDECGVTYNFDLADAILAAGFSRPGDYSHVTRLTAVSSDGYVFERYGMFASGVEAHLQDEGKTLKLFPLSDINK